MPPYLGTPGSFQVRSQSCSERGCAAVASRLTLQGVCLAVFPSLNLFPNTGPSMACRWAVLNLFQVTSQPIRKRRTSAIELILPVYLRLSVEQRADQAPTYCPGTPVSLALLSSVLRHCSVHRHEIAPSRRIPHCRVVPLERGSGGLMLEGEKKEGRGKGEGGGTEADRCPMILGQFCFRTLSSGRSSNSPQLRKI
ncbi:hypothetical protein LZ30DRAFT_704521 [Colletotrichum cereale]|nr:hypothetical protein LZ30DRAFT_704521 [Colletotrichum cereale]